MGKCCLLSYHCEAYDDNYADPSHSDQRQNSDGRQRQEKISGELVVDHQILSVTNEHKIAERRVCFA